MPNHPTKQGIQSAVIGIVANSILALTKGIAGFMGNSYALIADAIESFSDIFSSFIVMAGLKIASKPADSDHPYGHGKAEPMAAVIVALGLIAAAAIIAVKSVKEILMPHYAPAAYTLIVLVAVIAVKELLFRFVFRVGVEIKSTAIKTEAWHHRSDALTSAAAFVGISIALIGGKGYESADDYAALFASAIIVFNACRLMKPAVGELMDQAPSSNIEEKIKKIAKSVKGVVDLDKCHVRKMGLEYYVDLHVIVDGKISVKKGHEISHKVKNTLCGSKLKICDVLVHIEPDY